DLFNFFSQALALFGCHRSALLARGLLLRRERRAQNSVGFPVQHADVDDDARRLPFDIAQEGETGQTQRLYKGAAQHTTRGGACLVDVVEKIAEEAMLDFLAE